MRIIHATVDSSVTANVKDFARDVLHILVHHPMALNDRVNEVCNMRSLDYDGWQNTICEVRCFTYGSGRRKDPAGFVGALRQAHKQWHLQVGFPLRWKQVATDSSASAEEAPNKKHRAT